MNERDVAIAVAAGQLPSPTTWMGNTFVAMRFSGTGCAYRSSVGEYSLRDPDIWLHPDMLRRIASGVPVVIGHPDSNVLDGAEHAARVIGSTVLSYVKDDEAWCIARIVDRGIAAMIDKGEFSTSPAVVFAPGTTETLVLEDGSRLLIEPSPALLDHIAVVDRGVWDKGQPDEKGIDTNQTAEGTGGGGNE